MQDPTGITLSITSNSTIINTTPTLSKLNSTSYKVSNLNRTASTLLIPVQALTLTITGVNQPDSSRVIGSFFLSLYLNAEDYVTAFGVQGNSIAVIAGTVSGLAVAASSAVTSTVADVSIVGTYQNSIPIGGSIYITIP